MSNVSIVLTRKKTRRDIANTLVSVSATTAARFSFNYVCQRDLKSTGLRAGEETDRAMWRRKITSYAGDPT